MAKGEIVVELPMTGMTYAQYQSRAAKAFLELGWKLSPITTKLIRVTVAHPSIKNETLGCVSLSEENGKAILRFELSKPGLFGAEKATDKGLQKPFMSVFEKMVAEPDTDDPIKHNDEMIEVLAEQTRLEEEKAAKALARKKRIAKITTCMSIGFDAVCAGVGFAVTGEIWGLGAGIFVGQVLAIVATAAWKVFCAMP